MGRDRTEEQTNPDSESDLFFKANNAMDPRSGFLILEFCHGCFINTIRNKRLKISRTGTDSPMVDQLSSQRLKCSSKQRSDASYSHLFGAIGAHLHLGRDGRAPLLANTCVFFHAQSFYHHLSLFKDRVVEMRHKSLTAKPHLTRTPVSKVA